MDWIRIIGLGVGITAALMQIVALIVVLAGARDVRVARAFSAMAACMFPWSVWLALDYMPGSARAYEAVIRVLAVGLIFLPATVFHCAVVWSESKNEKFWALVIGGYAISVVVCTLHFDHLILSGFVEQPWGTFGVPGPLYPVLPLFEATWVTLGLIICIRESGRTVDARVRVRLEYWIIGALGGLPLGLTNSLTNYGIAVPPMGALGTGFVVLVFGYAAVRHRLMDIDVFVMRAAATLLAGVAVVLPVAGALIWMQQLPLGASGAVVSSCLVLAALVSLLMFSRLRSYFEQRVESSLFPARRAARDGIRRFSANLVKLPHSQDLRDQFTTTLMEGIGLSAVALYHRSTADRALHRTAYSGALAAPVKVLAADESNPGESVVLLSPDAPPDPSALASLLRDLGWEAFVRIRSEHRDLGVLTLGPKRSGGAIDDSDITLLALVASHVAVAFQNADFVQQIEAQKTAIEALQRRAEAENVVLRGEVRSHARFKDIVGSSRALYEVLALVDAVAPTQAPVLITGETGTGKELIARAIHDLSPRRNQPLICLNCGALPHDLAESELFGHERGAFTGAIESRAGRFELADGGTIFLDEVGELAPDIQVKLLRVLQDHEVQRVGSRTVRKLNLRVIAATNRDLRAEMRAQRFREDLFHRLTTLEIHVPPLRQRIDDIPALATHFLERAATLYQRPIKGFTRDAVDTLCHYSWPGNIRELQNVVERAVLLSPREAIGPEALRDLDRPPTPASTFGATVRAEKHRRVEAALAQSGGNQAAAARLLGMSRSNFARLMKSLGVPPPAKSSAA